MPHASLPPSASERWTSCPASVRMEREVAPDKDREIGSIYAQEGTQAHRLGEIKGGHRFGYLTTDERAELVRLWREETPEEWHDDIDRHTDSYVDLLSEFHAEHPHSVVRLEQRVDTGIPQCWGTLDAAVISPGHLRIVDLKYGQGVEIRAEKNPQLMLYGVGALMKYSLLGIIEHVTMTIFQPRLNNTSSWTMTARELIEWRDDLIPVAERALGPGAEFGPSDTACRWCAVRGECKARMRWVTRRDFGGDPRVLDPEDMSDALAAMPGIRQWCNDLEEAALTRAYSRGETIPGWKVVLSGGRRGITDEEAAVVALVDAGYPLEDVARMKAKTLGDLEKLVGYEELPEILGDLLKKSPGKPSLVTEDDKRPAIDPHSEAMKEFSEE